MILYSTLLPILADRTYVAIELMVGYELSSVCMSVRRRPSSVTDVLWLSVRSKGKIFTRVNSHVSFQCICSVEFATYCNQFASCCLLILDKIIAKTRQIAKLIFRGHCPLHARRRFNQRHL